MRKTFNQVKIVQHSRNIVRLRETMLIDGKTKYFNDFKKENRRTGIYFEAHSSGVIQVQVKSTRVRTGRRQQSLIEEHATSGSARNWDKKENI